MIENVLAIIGALGGFELVKYLLNRKSNSRIVEAEADHAELATIRELTEWLQKQLQAKENRFAEQTQLVRKLNTEVLELTREKAMLELEMVKVRCDDLACPFRQPPNMCTPPQEGLTKEMYQESKHKKEDTENG